MVLLARCPRVVVIIVSTRTPPEGSGANQTRRRWFQRTLRYGPNDAKSADRNLLECKLGIFKMG